jgi:hypothetical protein
MSMGASGVKLAAGLVPLEDVDSSDNGHQSIDKGDDAVLSDASETACNDGLALGSFGSALAVTQQFLVS